MTPWKRAAKSKSLVIVENDDGYRHPGWLIGFNEGDEYPYVVESQGKIRTYEKCRLADVSDLFIPDLDELMGQYWGVPSEITVGAVFGAPLGQIVGELFGGDKPSEKIKLTREQFVHYSEMGYAFRGYAANMSFDLFFDPKNDGSPYRICFDGNRGKDEPLGASWKIMDGERVFTVINPHCENA